MPLLATPDQQLIEQRALALMETAPIRAARETMTALFEAEPAFALTDQHPLLERSVDEHLFHAALVAASETPRAPRIVWSLALAHRWMGMEVPGSRFGHDNVDNVYRTVSVEENSRYRISGRFGGPRPCDFSLCALPKQVGEGIAADVLDMIGFDDIDIAADGSFAVLLDQAPRAGGRNRLSIAGARAVFIRDTMADWAVERPAALSIERLDGSAEDKFDPAAAGTRAAELSLTIARFFLDKVQHGMFEREPVNRLTRPAGAGQGGLLTQVGSVGHYHLAPDEVMLLDIDRAGARYLGVQILDRWMVSYDYDARTSSFSHAQARCAANGRFPMVIAAEDPGVANWLDSGGHSAGNILLRWQHLPGNAPPEDLVRLRLLKRDALAAALPAGTPMLTPAEREAQRAQRRRDYAARLG